MNGVVCLKNLLAKTKKKMIKNFSFSHSCTYMGKAIQGRANTPNRGKYMAVLYNVDIKA